MDQEKIIQQITNLFAGTDARDWSRVQNTMHEKVLLDYSSLTGNPASTLTPNDITAAWSAFLPGFDRTHHRLGGFIINVSGNNATAHFDGNADHYIDDQVWTVLGSYDTKFKLVNNQWRIIEFRFNFTKQSGNTELPKLASERMKGKS